MKNLFLALALVFGVLGFSQDYSIPAASPRQKVEQDISISKISVDYGRPGVKGRVIFGDLVPYGKVWRAGANAATKVTFGQNFIFGGKLVQAGSYALYIIADANEWKVILNTDADAWGAYSYDEKKNVLETIVPTQKLSDKVEWFTISFDSLSETSMQMKIDWDQTRVVVPIEVANQDKVNTIIKNLKEIKQIEKSMKEK